MYTYILYICHHYHHTPPTSYIFGSRKPYLKLFVSSLISLHRDLRWYISIPSNYAVDGALKLKHKRACIFRNMLYNPTNVGGIEADFTKKSNH